MAGNYSKIFLHVIMVVKHRKHVLSQANMDLVAANAAETLSLLNQQALTVAGTPDHLHLLLAMNPNYSVTELVREIRGATTRFIQERKWVRGRFCWQMGFAAFSYGQSQVESIRTHLVQQKDYHQRKSCREEYVDFLSRFGIPFEPEFLFRFPEDEPPG